MGSGKTETLLDTPVRKGASSSSRGSDIAIGQIRFQKDQSKDQVHAHNGNLYFRFPGVNKFIDLWEMFWSNAPSIGTPENRYHQVIFRGLPDDPGGGRVACDLVFEYEEGEWLVFLEEAGTAKGYVINDPTLMKANYYLKYDEK